MRGAHPSGFFFGFWLLVCGATLRLFKLQIDAPNNTTDKRSIFQTIFIFIYCQLFSSSLISFSDWDSNRAGRLMRNKRLGSAPQSVHYGLELEAEWRWKWECFWRMFAPRLSIVYMSLGNWLRVTIHTTALKKIVKKYCWNITFYVRAIF